MGLFLKAAAKKGSSFRIVAACLGLVIAAWLFASTTGGIGHGKMYLGPKTRHGIIVYQGENPPAFIAATAFNFSFATGLMVFSAVEVLSAVKRNRRG